MCTFCEGKEFREDVLTTGNTVKAWTSPNAHNTVFFTEYNGNDATREYVLTMKYCPFCGQSLSIADKRAAWGC